MPTCAMTSYVETQFIPSVVVKGLLGRQELRQLEEGAGTIAASHAELGLV